MYQLSKCPYSYFSKVLEFYFWLFLSCEYPESKFECSRNKECSGLCASKINMNGSTHIYC